MPVLPLLGLMGLPTAAALAGAALGERLTLSRRALGLALHAATGVVLGVVGVELLPRVLASGYAELSIAVFLLGGLFFIAVDAATDLVASLAGEEAGKGIWVLAVGVGIDFVTDGIMIMVGFAIDPGLGLLLALGAAVVEVPESFATMAVLKKRAPRKTRLVTMGGLILLIPLGGLLGRFFIGRPESWQIAVLAFTAGMLATLVVEELTPQSHRYWEGRFATVSFLVGFALFALLSVLLG